ncbi:hypothetical protein QCA50_000289 [Cerrena zonata]|uniref:Cytochrome P450 n=1 Tax=Cerrena zonata TaxID=2478898 RepID=A0AAW0GPW6_9APHY
MTFADVAHSSGIAIGVRTQSDNRQAVVVKGVPSYGYAYSVFIIVFVSIPMAPSLLTLDVLFAALALYTFYRFWGNRNRPSANVPPGPSGLPFVGNVLDMPTSYEHLTFAKWSERWGNIISVTLFGQRFVLLNDPDDATALLDKRGTNYSDRPPFTMSAELVGWKDSTTFMSYTEQFKKSRRYFSHAMGSKNTVKRHHGLIELENRKFLRRLLETPEDVHEHIRKMAGAIILMITHGYTVKEEGTDSFVSIADKVLDEFAQATTPGAFLVDALPILRYIPSWFPGARFQRLAAEWRKNLTYMVETPFELVRKQVQEGTAIPSVISGVLEDENLTSEQEYLIKWTATTMYAGGADTTVSAIYSFFLAMTLHPEWQRKAQKELDEVVGVDRLPTLSDRENLPYVEALMKEVLRFNPVANLGVPHCTREDDTYAGYYIPKGTVVIANLWAYLHNSDIYPDPLNFNPDRFLGSNPQRDPRDFTFGYGRRICPGLHLADASVFLSCALTLSAFDISKAVENGITIEPSGEYTSGTISHPKDFKCSIRPRTPRVASLISMELGQK